MALGRRNGGGAAMVVRVKLCEEFVSKKAGCAKNE